MPELDDLENASGWSSEFHALTINLGQLPWA